MKDRILLFFKGLAMGAADVVPGVSGGTIAFISGIYEELIDSIARIDHQAVKILFQQGPVAFWKRVNGTFFLFLLGGIGTAILSLAPIITWLLKNQPILIWSFFFGLVVASIWLVVKQVKQWNVGRYLAFALGSVIAYGITILPMTAGTDSLPYLFLSGMIAICAMILPGISGSFILVLMGSYATVLGAIEEKNLAIIGVFGTGAVLGLLSFSHALKWLFARFHDLTVALLSGFLLGSLNKVWPWKEVVESFTKHPNTPKEEVIPVLERNLWPTSYAELVGEPQTAWAVLLAAAGMALIVGLEWWGNRRRAA
jgi:putative membrane protein